METDVQPVTGNLICKKKKIDHILMMVFFLRKLVFMNRALPYIMYKAFSSIQPRPTAEF